MPAASVIPATPETPAAAHHAVATPAHLHLALVTTRLAATVTTAVTTAVTETETTTVATAVMTVAAVGARTSVTGR